MNQETWTAVDRYISDLLTPPDAGLEGALKESTEAGLPEIQITPAQGKLLRILARSIGSRRILEMETLGGYSTIWLAGALPQGGELITLEAEPKHAEVARRNIEAAGFGNKVQLLLGPAVESLPKLSGPFDFTFIDANKDGYPDYLSWAIQLSRSGSIIVGDNLVRGGEVINPERSDNGILGIRRFNEMLASDPRVTATIIQNVGAKGYDGFSVAIVN